MIALQVESRQAPELVGRFLNRALFTIGDTPVTPATLIAVSVVVLITLAVSQLAQRGTRRALTMRSKADEATVAVSTRLVHYAVLLIGLGVALQTIGLNLGALFTAGAFFAIALGFAMQNVAQNFVAGIILMTERTIKPGDVLEVDGLMVRVTHLGLRATVVRSRDEEDLIIPNSVLVQNTVTNYTLRDTTFRLRAEVSVAYGSDMNEVLRVLRKAADEFPSRVEYFEPVAFMTEFADSGVNFEVSVWVEDPWQARRTRSELNMAIWSALQAAGITIPFPQRDVHLHPVPAAPDPQ